MPFVVVDVFLVKRPAQTLRGAALHLAFDVARMNRLAGVLRNGAAQDLDFAGIGIDFDIDQQAGKGRSDAAPIDRCAPD